MNIYNDEVIELEIKILEKIKNKLLFINDSKIKSNSKAFIELKSLISEINSEILFLKQENNNKSSKNSVIKISTSTFKDLVSLKIKLKVDTIAELLDLLVSSYDEFFLIDSLIEVKPYILDKYKTRSLNETDFYVCIDNDSNSNYREFEDKILYKLDDLTIFNNKEYLDLKIFKTYNFANDTFKISPRYTLQDIDLFMSIWNKKYI